MAGNTTRSELRDLTNFILNNNDGQTNQAYTTIRVNQALDMAYRKEMNAIRLEAGWKWTRVVTDVSWPASQVKLELPASISQQGIIGIRDITNSNPGPELVISNDRDTERPFWLDRNTLQWGTSGPPSATTLRFIYWPRVIMGADDDSEPDLIPYDFRDVLAWSAAVILSKVGDITPPQSWLDELRELRSDMWVYLGSNRPMEVPFQPRMYDVDDTYGYLIV